MQPELPNTDIHAEYILGVYGVCSTASFLKIQNIRHSVSKRVNVLFLKHKGKVKGDLLSYA